MSLVFFPFRCRWYLMFCGNNKKTNLLFAYEFGWCDVRVCKYWHVFKSNSDTEMATERWRHSFRCVHVTIKANIFRINIAKNMKEFEFLCCRSKRQSKQPQHQQQHMLNSQKNFIFRQIINLFDFPILQATQAILCQMSMLALENHRWMPIHTLDNQVSSFYLNKIRNTKSAT